MKDLDTMGLLRISLMILLARAESLLLQHFSNLASMGGQTQSFYISLLIGLTSCYHEFCCYWPKPLAIVLTSFRISIRPQSDPV